MNAIQALQEYHRIRLVHAAESFRKRGFRADVFGTGAEAAERFFEHLNPDESVGYGGSETTTQLGIKERLRSGTYRFLDRAKVGHSYAEQLEIRRETLSADVLIASSNAVSMEGALVNIDGDGNRTAAMSLGPGRVVLFIGRNKVCDDLERAIYRARNVAAPALALQLGKATPCAKTGRCHDCSSPDRICSNLLVIDRCVPPGRIHVLLINEDLGL